MKFYCITKVKLTKARKELIYMMHPRLGGILRGLDSVEKNLSDGDVLAMDSVLELDSSDENNIDIIVENYKKYLDNGIDLIFDRSPSLDSDIILLQPFSDKDLLLRIKIGDYINNRQALINMKQYAQKKAKRSDNKTYGRPKGTLRDSKQAIKVKNLIRKKSKYFNGTCTDLELIKESGVSRRMYYVYKKSLLEKEENDVSL